jgi:hypothetical protein
LPPPSVGTSPPLATQPATVARETPKRRITPLTDQSPSARRSGRDTLEGVQFGG